MTIHCRTDPKPVPEECIGPLVDALAKLTNGMHIPSFIYHPCLTGCILFPIISESITCSRPRHSGFGRDLGFSSDTESRMGARFPSVWVGHPQILVPDLC